MTHQIQITASLTDRCSGQAYFKATSALSGEGAANPRTIIPARMPLPRCSMRAQLPALSVMAALAGPGFSFGTEQ